MRAAFTLAAAALVASGCMSAELARVRRDVGRDLPGLGEGHALAFGRLSLGLARGFVGGDDDTAEILRHVRGVAVGTYSLRDPLDAGALDLPTAMARIEARGWTPIVVSRDAAEAAFVFSRGESDTLRDLLVVSFDDGEMTLVRLSGNLDAAVLAALRSGDSDGMLSPLQIAVRPETPRTSGG